MVLDRARQAVRPTPGGFVLWGGAPEGKPWDEGAISFTVPDVARR